MLISIEEKRKSRINNCKLALIVIAALIAALILFREPLLARAGNALVASDPLREADAIVVLMGSVPDRIVHGAELYKEGYSRRLVMVRTKEYEAYDIMEELDLDIPGLVDINKDIALQLGVPQKDIIVLDHGSDSTFDEAVAVKDYLEANNKTTVIVVTSKYHSARAKETFARVTGNDFEIILSPSPYDPFDPDQWWKHRAHARSLFFEYLKLINLYLFQF